MCHLLTASYFLFWEGELSYQTLSVSMIVSLVSGHALYCLSRDPFVLQPLIQVTSPSTRSIILCGWTAVWRPFPCCVISFQNFKYVVVKKFQTIFKENFVSWLPCPFSFVFLLLSQVSSWHHTAPNSGSLPTVPKQPVSQQLCPFSNMIKFTWTHEFPLKPGDSPRWNIWSK